MDKPESPCACWPGRMCNRSEQCAANVRADKPEGKAAQPVARDDVRDNILREAVAHHGGKWPDELYSGVMFFKGERITKAEFGAAIQSAKGEGK